MADTTQQTEPNPQDQAGAEPQGANPPEPQGNGTDWKAEARKWEARAKENKQKAEKLDELEAANKSELERLQEAKAKAEKEAADAKAELARNEMISSVSKETGVPEELLHGDTEEELRESAEAVKGYIASQKPSIPPDQGGAAGAKPVTKEAIEDIDNPVARVRARAQNISLYQ